MKRYGLFSNCFYFLPVSLSYIEKKHFVPLSDCKRFLIFRSEFPTIPRKISAYLQSDFPSGANTRNTSGFCKLLNVNNLYLRGISSHCKKHHFGLRNGPYWRPKSTISHPEMGFFALRNGLYRKAERTFPDYIMGYIKMRYYTKCPLSYTI